MKNTGLWLGGLLVFALSGCAKQESESAPPPRPPNVSVITLAPEHTRLEEDLPARIAPLRVAEIRPQVSGIIQKRLFEQGAQIRAGQPLFQINAAPFRAEVDIAAAALERAQATLTQAQLQSDRLEVLVKADAVSRQVYDDAHAARQQAAADVSQARAALARKKLDVAFATVEAPIDGRIDQALVTEGALVGPSEATPLARIQQINQVYVDVRQPASALESLRSALAPTQAKDASASEGLPATILRANGEPYPMVGRILFSGINVDPGTGDVLLRIVVDNPEQLLLPGMFVRTRVLRQQYENALLVPQNAVSHVGGQAQVWVVDAEQRAHATRVELGELIGRHYRIASGLTAGQKVVIAGAERLTDGAQVTAKNADTAPRPLATEALLQAPVPAAPATP